MLSAIPASAFSGSLNFFSHEAFYTLRASLTYYNVDRPLSSVLVTSAAKDDGKTLVATQLAVALARTGKDVIVLDTDLRRSTAAARLGLGRPTQGLSDVLSGQLSLADGLLDVETGEDSPGRLRLLPAGHAPPNPSELVGSQRMRDLIGEVAELADITIIDTAPLLTVSDSLPLVKVVSGTVLVARVRASSRHAVVRVRNIVATAGGAALGVVATGASADGVYSGYNYGYEESDSNGSARGRGVFKRGARTR
jgi:capsular exopolysaccharide synthesis family protein